MTGILLGPVFAAAEGGTVALGDQDIFGTGKIATFRLMADGFTYYHDGALHQGQTWINPQEGMELYEVKATLEGGSHSLQNNSGLGTWLAAVGSPQWGYNSNSPKIGAILVSIRAIGSVTDEVTDVRIGLETTGSLGGGGGSP